MNVVPITAIIVLLLPGHDACQPALLGGLPRARGGLGAVVGLLVSFVVLPSSAHRQMRQAASRILDLMARALTALIAGAAPRARR